MQNYIAKRKNFDIDIKTEEPANAVKAAHISTITAFAVMTAERTNKWAMRRGEIRNACSAFTDEEIRLYECVALASWENR